MESIIDNVNHNSILVKKEFNVSIKRWIVLSIFCLISFLNAFNWIEYSIIQDVTIAFYNESLPVNQAEQAGIINWFSMIYMVCYIPLVFPAMFLLDSKGLKLSIVLGNYLKNLKYYFLDSGLNIFNSVSKIFYNI